MKFKLLILPLLAFSLTGCDDFMSSFGQMMGDNPTLYEFKEMSGRWNLVDHQNPFSDVTEAYFVFDGAKNVMNAKYYENGELKMDTTFKGVYNGKGESNPLSITLKKPERNSESFVGDMTMWAYTEDSQANLKQFTVCYEDYNVGTVRGMVDYHSYQLDNVMFAFGTYVKEGNEFTPYQANYREACEYRNGYFYNEEANSYFYHVCNIREGMNDCRSLFAYVSNELEKPIFASLYHTINNGQNYAMVYQEHSLYEPYEKAAGLTWPPAMYLENYTFTETSFTFTSVRTTETGNTQNLKADSFAFGTYTLVETKPNLSK